MARRNKFEFSLEELDDQVLNQIRTPTAPNLNPTTLGQVRGVGLIPIPTFIPKKIKPPKLQGMNNLPFLGGLK